MTLKRFLWLSLLVILLLPVVIFQAKKLPFWLLAHEIVSDAPCVNRLLYLLINIAMCINIGSIATFGLAMKLTIINDSYSAIRI